MTCFYEVPKENISCNTASDYRPLPSTITDFIAEEMCSILDTHQPPGFKWDNVPLPELVLFIKKVTTKAKVDVPTAIASLVLASRFKKRLPKNAHGEYGTYHKIFLASLLIASKEFMPKTEEEVSETPTTHNDDNQNQSDSESNPNDENDENDENETSTDDDTNSNLSESPNSNILSTTPLSTLSISDDDDQDNGILFKQVPAPNNVDYKQINVVRPVINKKLCDISGIYNISEVDLMEKEFMWRLGGNNKVTDKDIREFVESNRHALGIH